MPENVPTPKDMADLSSKLMEKIAKIPLENPVEINTRCPTCDSPDPTLHPAVQNGGEVTKECEDHFHCDVTTVYHCPQCGGHYQMMAYNHPGPCSVKCQKIEKNDHWPAGRREVRD